MKTMGRKVIDKQELLYSCYLGFGWSGSQECYSSIPGHHIVFIHYVSLIFFALQYLFTFMTLRVLRATASIVGCLSIWFCLFPCYWTRLMVSGPKLTVNNCFFSLQPVTPMVHTTSLITGNRGFFN